MGTAASRMEQVLVPGVARASGTSASEMISGLLDALAEHPDETLAFLAERGVIQQVPLEAVGTRLPQLFQVVQ